jgi:UDP-2,3-diacylglucosamine hydrolase
MRTDLQIPCKSAVVVADAHLNADDAHSRAFLRLAEGALAEGSALFLLGDIFDLWFGTEGLTFGFQRPVIERLRALRREGLKAYYVEGNRDFFLKRRYEGDLFESVAGEAMRVRLSGRTIHMAHGDTVNRADRAYRFWKAISKNRVAFGAASMLPSSIVLPLADRIEKRLRPTNPRFKGRFPESEILDFAGRTFGSGADFVLLGHFHTEFLRTSEIEGRRRTLAVLPCWKESHRALVLDEAGDALFRRLPDDAR